MKDDEKILIRTPNEADAAGIISYAKILFASTDQVLTTPEEFTITLTEEKAWIKTALDNPNALILIAEWGSGVVGLLDFTAKTKKKIAHTGELGVSVHPDYRGRGIGQSLIETLLVWAKDNKQIEKVFLNVLDTNSRAILLYKKLGFKEEGRHVKAIKQSNGEYVDLIQMYVET